MNEHERHLVNEAMREASERRARVEARHRSVIAGSRFVSVEHARLPVGPALTAVSSPSVTAMAVSYETKSVWHTPPSWDKPDGFELAVFRSPGARVFVPPHLYESSDRSWRCWEVP